MSDLNIAVRFRDMPMERKLILIFLFLIILPISALSYFSFDRYSQSIEMNTAAYVTELSDKLIGRLDEYIADMKRLTAVPGAVDEIRTSLQVSNEYYSRLSTPQEQGTYLIPEKQGAELAIQQQIEKSIFFLNNVKEGASSIYLFNNYGEGYYRIQVGGVRSDINTVYYEWKKIAREARGNAVLISTQEFINDFKSKGYVFTVVREIFSPELEPLGLIAVDAGVSVLEKYVKDLDKVTGGQTFILDKDNKVIFDSNKQFLAQNISDDPLVRKMIGLQGSFFHETKEGKVLGAYTQSESTGWKVLITVPVERLTEDAVKNRNFTIIATLLIIVFALFISIFLSFMITKPLRSLMQLMKTVHSGNLDVVFPIKRSDEVGRLGFHFNRMISRIRELINDNYAIQLRRKEAELLALQSQINPHFLYNTLESIRMSAEVNDDAEVADMIHLLGKMLRYSINTKNEVVLLDQEMEHLETFMRIVEYRYPNRFEFDIQDYESLDKLKIPKLVFQPIVENAVLHGFDESKDKLIVKVAYRIEEDQIEFRIMDDGTGMDPGTLLRLRETLMEPLAGENNTLSGGIGLRNVNERIQLIYGTSYGLDVSSEPGHGTEVTVRLPYNA